MVSPSVIQFNVDHYLCGNTYRCVWALREYPTATDEQAILRHLGEKDGITLRIYTRQVTPAEEKRIIHNAANKHRMSRSSTDDLQQTVTAESNLQDVVTLVSAMHRNREPLLHCAVYLELTAQSYDQLKLLQTEVLTELVRSKLNVDRLMLRQQQGFVSVMPSGHNAFGSQFERVLPASSVANLYPFNYSGKTDPQGFYIGKDKYGANVIVDFDKRDDDKTSANILILGNSGQGKSYLMKLLLLNLLEAGKSAISLDVEHEQKDMCEAVGGCFLDLMSGQYRINPLEPKCWDDGGSPEDMDAPAAFRQSTRLSQHISFLRDFSAPTRASPTARSMLSKSWWAGFTKDGTSATAPISAAWPRRIIPSSLTCTRSSSRSTGILMRESINSTPPPFCRKFCWVFTPCARGRRASFSTATPM